jgi:fructose-1,6-bisphosphatase I
MGRDSLTLHDYLYESKIEDDLRYLIDTIARVGKQISYRIKTVELGVTGTQNVFGEEQKALDVYSNDITKFTLMKSGLVSVLASEEEDSVIKVDDKYFGRYAVCFDPLDGSSLIDVNFALGSIFSIYKGDSFLGQTGDDQVASLYIMYGPRTTLVLTVKQGTHEFILNDVGEFHLSRKDIKIAKEGKVFGPGDLKACSISKKYDELMHYWLKNRYKLRYSGGMVPDINHVLMKGKGIFTYPCSKDNPNGKLRVLFECHPMATVLEIDYLR